MAPPSVRRELLHVHEPVLGLRRPGARTADRPGVRYPLRNRELTPIRPDGTAEHRVVGPEEFADMLATTFGIVLEPEETALALRATAG
ncbi:MAG: hypothetical protein JWO67_4997 [Streptosporangiaceae bacterium]|nr:hypothetical protein [Streptosporangiaceae bacterium]